MTIISTDGLSENDDDEHRRFTQNRAQAIFEGRGCPLDTACPCAVCTLLYKKEVEVTPYERALQASTKRTYDAMPKEMEHFARPEIGFGEYPAALTTKTINMGWD